MTHPADQHPDTLEHDALTRLAAPGDADFPGVDLDMLAYDIADMLERNGYPVDVASTHVRPAARVPPGGPRQRRRRRQQLGRRGHERRR